MNEQDPPSAHRPASTSSTNSNKSQQTTTLPKIRSDSEYSSSKYGNNQQQMYNNNQKQLSLQQPVHPHQQERSDLSRKPLRESAGKACVSAIAYLYTYAQ